MCGCLCVRADKHAGLFVRDSAATPLCRLAFLPIVSAISIAKIVTGRCGRVAVVALAGVRESCILAALVRDVGGSELLGQIVGLINDVGHSYSEHTQDRGQREVSSAHGANGKDSQNKHFHGATPRRS